MRSWPAFLIREMPPELRARIEAEASSSGQSMAEVMRTILCAHYGLDCDPVEALSGPPAPIPNTTTMILRMQPDLFYAVRDDALGSGTAMRTLIVGALEAHYEEER